MANYDKDTKFYWLQLKEDFFEDDAIAWLEEQEPNGRDYAYFYLKLCLKSLKSNGVLIRKVGNILIPYDNKKLAELTKMDFDTVCVAMKLLQEIGLVQILENGEIYINQLENLIGSKSLGAFKKQQQRLLGGQGVDKCPPKIEIDIEKELDIEIDKEKNKPSSKPIKHKYGKYQHVFLTNEQYEKLKSDYPNEYEAMIQELDEGIELKGYSYKNHYLAVLNWHKRSKERANNTPYGKQGFNEERVNERNKQMLEEYAQREKEKQQEKVNVAAQEKLRDLTRNLF